MFSISVCDPKGESLITTIRDIIDINIERNLSQYGTGMFCISCKNIALENPERLKLKNQLTIFCQNYGSEDPESTGVLFHGYIHTITQEADQICIEMIDCLGRLQRRMVRQDYKVTRRADEIIFLARANMDAKEQVGVRLGEIYVPTEIRFNYEVGISAYDMLTDIAERTGAEFRVRYVFDQDTRKVSCLLDMVLVDDDHEYGVGELLDGRYEYNHEIGASGGLTDRSLAESIENFCNTNYSRDPSNLIEPVCEHADQDDVEKCGLWECFTYDPDGQNEQPRTDIALTPTIEIDPTCTDRCDEQIGDRKHTVIRTKYDSLYEFDAIITSIMVSCRNGEAVVNYSMGTTNNVGGRLRSESDVIGNLARRIRKLERHQ